MVHVFYRCQSKSDQIVRYNNYHENQHHFSPQCLIGNQFFRLRWGDNYFYDLGGERRPWRFTLEQLSELRRSSWSRVLCNAIPTMSVIQPDAFRAEGEGNRLTACSQLPDVSLEMWREEVEVEEPKREEMGRDELGEVLGEVLKAL